MKPAWVDNQFALKSALDQLIEVSKCQEKSAYTTLKRLT